MKIISFKLFLLLLFFVSISLGFRTKGFKYAVSIDDPTVWIKVCDTSAVLPDGQFEEGDPLSTFSTITFKQAAAMVARNINSVPFSFIRAAVYPDDPDNPGDPLAGDSTFTKEKAATRTINLCFRNSQYNTVSEGTDKEVEGNTIVNCNFDHIDADEPAQDIVEDMIEGVVLCMGLDRAQETEHGVTSYFWTRGWQLGEDDKMGLSFLYPVDGAVGKEDNTAGMSCGFK